MANCPAERRGTGAALGVLLHRSAKYRIYPTPEQAERLRAWEGALRFLWNLGLEQWNWALSKPKGRRPRVSAISQQRELTDLRASLPWLNDVPRHACAHVLKSLDEAWQRCFRKISGRPRWKKRGDAPPSIMEFGATMFRLRSGVLVFPKLGEIRCVQHRPLPGRQLTAQIVRDVDQWFVAIRCEVTIADPAPRLNPAVGIDRGVVNTVADSTGRIVENPRHYERTMKRLARAQRQVAKKARGSKNREKAKVRVAKLHRKVRRQRAHFLHGLSHDYAESQGVVVVEALRIGAMSSEGGARKRGLNRSIVGAGWGEFVRMLSYKMEERGGTMEEVPAAYTSQACSACGVIDAENRASQATFRCVACGHAEHADVNAAKNILSRRVAGVAACGGPGARGRPMKQEVSAARRLNRRRKVAG